jgi:quercetin dioxygenase-like cupin family protein
MKHVAHWRSIVGHRSDLAGARGVTKRLVLGPSDGTPHFALRVFSLEPGGQTPRHRHDFEHEVIVLEGQGAFEHEGGSLPVEAGSVVFVAPNELHQFRASETQGLSFACIVPNAYA